ncbi:MAG TPA: exopolysaccharide biosynthesis polyprenyl glycosylphosphotransferase [Bryobacteraceae bacterium]
MLLLESPDLLATGRNPAVLEKITLALSQSTRDTDTRGWYKEGSMLGIVFTEIEPDQASGVGELLQTKISRVLSSVLGPEAFAQVRFSRFLFPEDWGRTRADGCGSEPHPEPRDPHAIGKAAKRCIDISGGLILLLLSTPVLAAVAVAIKLTSEGPVLFRQSRQGLFGRPFTFLKFRSMYEKNDPKIHEDYVKRLISGDPDLRPAAAGGERVFKITNDPRITPVGRFLRRTSLDELPQFINVLKGDMSLVGPRPPLSYEVVNYAPWHKRRLRTKPGITGLWQVRGRSKVTFDEMVRLDLQYGRTWSLSLDLKILLQTPWAVLMGNGAY